MAAEILADPAQLSVLLQRPVVSCALADSSLEKINTLSSLRWASVRFEDGGATSLVLKSGKSGDPKAQLYGLAREGLFYARWVGQARAASLGGGPSASLLATVLPEVHYASGDMSTGAKTILMEDLSSCVQCGYFFGAGNPNNWGKDLAAERKGFALTTAEATALCFSAAAKLHAPYWNDLQALRGGDEDSSWLRGSEWLRGRDEASWQASQARVAELWAAAKAAVADGSSAVRWDPALVALMDASVAKADWSSFQAELAARPFTLTHGDFHPANFMVRPPSEKTAQGGGSGTSQHTLALVDWEVVGLGSGPQDLGQFLISHAEPEVRAALERGAVEAYYAELKALNPAVEMTMEECWEEYVRGGLGRWLWFLPLLCTMCPPPMGQYFHDQVLAFVASHGVTTADVPMPRA